MILQLLLEYVILSLIYLKSIFFHVYQNPSLVSYRELLTLIGLFRNTLNISLLALFAWFPILKFVFRFESLA